MNKPKSQKISGGQAAVLSLKKEKTKHVFGLIGSATMEMFDALYKEKSINFIGVRDERTGAHMADGYARASNRPGVILAGQNGPGATNLVTGIAQAAAAFSPVVSIAGSFSTKDKVEDAFQGIDQQSLFKPITKKTWTITKTKEIPKIFSNAFNLAMSPRRGPVQLNLPRNILSDNAKFNINQNNKSYETESTTKGKKNDIKKAVAIINSGSKQVIIVGGGIKYTSKYKEVIKLAELLNVPMVTAAGHGDSIPFSHKLNAGQMGPRGNPVASKLTKEADVIIAIGTRLGFNSTFYTYDNLNKKAKIIQIELEKKMLGRYFPISIGICADASTATKQIYNEIKEQKLILETNKWTKKYLKERSIYLNNRNNESDLNKFPIQPKGLFKQLRNVLPKNSAITLDAGTLCLQATDALEYYDPPSLFTPLDFGLVGFSFACGLGVKIARPNKTVVSLMGDGGFGMTISELSTAVDYGINTITIVMNNKSWGAEKAYQKDFFGKRYIGADISSPPFDKVATLYGAKGYKVEKVSEINEAVKAAMLAWEMNGVPLPNAHGGPLRMVTPGYFGINNVKHLGQVAFTKTESTVKYMKSSYRISPIGKKGSQYPSCWEMTVKSWITRPTDETGTAKAGNVQIVGVAMGGTKKVRSVKVSIDGGQSWKKAKFVGPDLGKYAWRQFVFEANLAPGSYNLASKASAGGKTQPELRYENRRGYAHNGWKDHSVNIKVV